MTTVFRPGWCRMVSGTRTVMLAAAGVTPPPALQSAPVSSVRPRSRTTLASQPHPKPDVSPAWSRHDPIDQQPHDMGMLSWEQFFPKWVQFTQGLPTMLGCDNARPWKAFVLRLGSIPNQTVRANCHLRQTHCRSMRLNPGGETRRREVVGW